MLIFKFIIIIILLLLSAFFSSSETAYTTISPHRLRRLLDEERKHAKTLEKILNNKEKMLSVVLICNNIVNISVSAVATVVVQELFGNAAISIGTGILTILVLIFGEVGPKTLATYRADQIGLLFAPVIWALMVVFTPLATAINFIARICLKIFGVKQNEKNESYTENEIRSIVDVSYEEGVTTTEEKQIINNVFDFTDTTVKEVMVPKINVTAIDMESTYEEIKDIFLSEKYTRLPVLNNDSEEFIGQINVKDFVFFKEDEINHFKVQDILRNLNYTFETKHLSDLLLEMKRDKQAMMAVMDEYGSTVGIVTMEDLLEELVGEIRDEYDGPEDDGILKQSDGCYLIKGHISLDDLNDRLSFDMKENAPQFTSENMDSVGGLLIEHLGRLPKEGDKVELGSCTFSAHTIDKNRIEIVGLVIHEE